jgi:hypothetical protein
MTERRRFPPPWSVEETAPCFIVRDANGQALVFVYREDEPGRRATGKLLTRDEARRIAANIAKLPELLATSADAGDTRLSGQGVARRSYPAGIKSYLITNKFIS